MPKIKPGDLVKIHYTGRLASDSSVFETTDEETARQGGIWSTASFYGPKLVVFGKGAMLPGLEDAVVSLNPGQGGTFKIPPEKAFGPRFPELVRVVPEAEFRKNGVRPETGLTVMVDRLPALVKTVSSGRVVLDFNRPFAGQDVEYAVQLLEVLSEPVEKARALGTAFGLPVRVESSAGKNRIAISSTGDAKKARGLEAALKAAFGGWGEVVIEK